MDGMVVGSNCFAEPSEACIGNPFLVRSGSTPGVKRQGIFKGFDGILVPPETGKGNSPVKDMSLHDLR